LDRRPPHSEFEGTKLQTDTFINRNTTFEPLSVQFGPKLWAGRGNGKKKKAGEESHKTVIFHHQVEASLIFTTDLHQIW